MSSHITLTTCSCYQLRYNSIISPVANMLLKYIVRYIYMLLIKHEES